MKFLMHRGFFRLYPVNDHIRLWRLDDGTENGWKASAAWVDIEPDIRISINKDGRMVWLYGDGEVHVTEASCCCPNGYAFIATPLDESRDPDEWTARFCGTNAANYAADWLTSIGTAEVIFVLGLGDLERVAVFAMTQRARDWASNKLTASGNFSSVFVYFANEQETNTLKEQVQDVGLHALFWEVERLG
jgi:hypothetical protein